MQRELPLTLAQILAVSSEGGAPVVGSSAVVQAAQVAGCETLGQQWAVTTTGAVGLLTQIGSQNCPSTDGGLSGGAIAGIVVGILVFLAIVAVVIACIVSKRQQAQIQDNLAGQQSRIEDARRTMVERVPSAAKGMDGASQWGIAVGGLAATDVITRQFEESGVAL